MLHFALVGCVLMWNQHITRGRFRGVVAKQQSTNVLGYTNPKVIPMQVHLSQTLSAERFVMGVEWEPHLGLSASWLIVQVITRLVLVTMIICLF